MLNHCTEMGLTLAGLQPTALGVKAGCRRGITKRSIAPHITAIAGSGSCAGVDSHSCSSGIAGDGVFFWGLLFFLHSASIFPERCGVCGITMFHGNIRLRLTHYSRRTASCRDARPTEQDLARARQTILMQSDTLADLSLNFIKGRLVVEVAPRTQKPDLEQYAPGSVVAAKGGIIDHLEVEHGFAVVGAGQRVEAGDLLITGVYIDEKTENVVITPAQGVVVARTETVYQSAQPLQFTAHIPTGEVIEYRTLIMGGRRIPLSLQPEEPVLFSQEVRSEPVSLFGFALPAVLETRSLYPEKETQIQLTEQQAAERARFLLDRALESESDTEEILQRSFDGQLTDGVFHADIDGRAAGKYRGLCILTFEKIEFIENGNKKITFLKKIRLLEARKI